MKIDTQSGFVFDEPTRMIYGQGKIADLSLEIEKAGLKSTVIVCDKGIVEAGIIERIMKILESVKGLSIAVFDGIIPNPLDTTMDAGYEFALEHNADSIIGVGGGSSLDSAKGIAMLLTNGGKMREYLMEGRTLTRPIAYTVCIPTTAGTGSEVTRTIVATDAKTSFKEGFKDVDLLVAKIAIIDPELMLKLPKAVLAACGMDALTHAIESFTSWKANPVTDALNGRAIRMIGKSLRSSYCDPNDLNAKGQMLLASALTGIAFDQSGLGLAHVLGHPMGGLFNIPHGVACAMALPVAMEYNLMASPEKFAEIAELLGEPPVHGNVRKQAESAIIAVRDMMKDLVLPEKLSAVGIMEKDIPAMAKDAMGFPGMIGANPRTADKSEIEKLYRKFL